jgi:hypothetical protein
MKNVHEGNMRRESKNLGRRKRCLKLFGCIASEVPRDGGDPELDTAERMVRGLEKSDMRQSEPAGERSMEERLKFRAPLSYTAQY